VALVKRSTYIKHPFGDDFSSPKSIKHGLDGTVSSEEIVCAHVRILGEVVEAFGDKG